MREKEFNSNMKMQEDLRCFGDPPVFFFVGVPLCNLQSYAILK